MDTNYLLARVGAQAQDFPNTDKVIEDKTISSILEPNCSSILTTLGVVGAVCSPIPVSVTQLGHQTFITALVDRSFVVYDSNLRLVYLHPPIPGVHLTALTTLSDMTILGTRDGELLIFNKRVLLMNTQKIGDPVKHIQVIGNSFCVTVGTSGVIRVFRLTDHIVDDKTVTHVSRSLTVCNDQGSSPLAKSDNARNEGMPNTRDLFETSSHDYPVNLVVDRSVRTVMIDGIIIPVEFKVNAASAIPTYVNKILLGGNRLEIWDVDNQTLVHTYRCLNQVLDKFSRESDSENYTESIFITCISPSTCLDICAIGASDGKAFFANLRTDELIFCFSVSFDGTGLVAITFVSTEEEPDRCIVGSDDGMISVWDLEGRRLVSSIIDHLGECCKGDTMGNGTPTSLQKTASMVTDAKQCKPSYHSTTRTTTNSVVSLTAIRSTPLIVHSSPNHLCIMIMEDGNMRTLRKRVGHQEEISSMIHYSDGVHGENDILYSSGSNIGLISPIQGHQSVIFSNKSFPMTLPPVISLRACRMRHFDWPAILTVHESFGPRVLIWSGLQKCILKRVLVFQEDYTESARMSNSNDSLSDVVGNSFYSDIFDVQGQSNSIGLAITRCGNFAFASTDVGSVQEFRLQSGIHSGVVYRVKGHEEGQILGIEVIGIHTLLIVFGFPAVIKFIGLKTRDVLREVAIHNCVSIRNMLSSKPNIPNDDTYRRYHGKMESVHEFPVNFTLTHSVSRDALIFMAAHLIHPGSRPSSHILVYDMDIGKIVRRFRIPHFDYPGPQSIASKSFSLSSVDLDSTLQAQSSSRITCLSASSSGNFAYIGVNDKRLFVYDVGCDVFVDRVILSSVPRCISVSPDDRRLYVSMSDGVSHYVHQFDIDLSGVLICPSDYVVVDGCKGDSVSGTLEEIIVNGEEGIVTGGSTDKNAPRKNDHPMTRIRKFLDKRNQTTKNKEFIKNVCGQNSVITMSGISSSRLSYLLRLEQIRERNRTFDTHIRKPINETAPFFIPTRLAKTSDEGVSDEFKRDTSELDSHLVPVQFSRTVEARFRDSIQTFHIMIRDKEYENANDWLKVQSPSAVHLSLHLLNQEGECLQHFVEYLKCKLAEGVDADLHIMCLRVCLDIFSLDLLHGGKDSEQKAGVPDLRTYVDPDVLEALSNSVKDHTTRFSFSCGKAEALIRLLLR